MNNDYPESVNGVTTRINPDGSFSLPRCKREVQRYLDNKYIRCNGELRWFPRIIDAKTVDELKPLFGDTCYIVGKGPSLDKLAKEHFKNTQAPVFCINESIHAIEALELKNPVIAIQQDTGLRDGAMPKKSKIAVSRDARFWYAQYPETYVYQPEHYKLASNSLTVLCAINIAKSFGVKNFKMLAFDACTDGETSYAKSVGKTPGGTPERFLKHKQVIEAAAKVEWITRKDLDSKESDTAPLWPQHQKEHREPSQP